MEAAELQALEVAKLVDARGTACPGPLLDAKRALGDTPSGGIMEVQSSDSGTITDIQRWCKKMGFEYLGDREDDGYWCIYLKKA